MKKIHNALRFLLPVVIFVLPWQTAYVFREGALPGLIGPWQYGTIQLYGLDLFVITLLVCGAIARHDRIRRIAQTEMLFLGTLVIAAFLAIWFAQDRAVALIGAIRLSESLGIYWLLRTMPISTKSIALWWIAGAFIQSVMAIEQFSAQQIDANSWLGIAYHSPKVLGDSVVENADFRWLRAYGSFPHPNILAVYLAFGLVCLFWLIGQIEQKWKMYLLFLAAAILSAGLFFTFSRGGWTALLVAAIASGTIALFLRSKTRPTDRFSPTLVCALVCAMTMSLLSFVWWEPLSVRIGMQGWQRLEQKSFVERIGGLRDALSLIPRHLEGVGAGNYTNVFTREKNDPSRRFAGEYQPAHVMPLVALVETGILGFAALLLLCWHRIRECVLKRMCTPIDIAFVALLIAPLFSDHFYWTLFPGILLWWIGWGLMGSICRKGT